jgi:hypothetical protein
VAAWTRRPCSPGANHTRRIAAFTVFVPRIAGNEEPFARAVVDRFRDQVDYHVFEPPDDDLLEPRREFVAMMGEPFHSPTCTRRTDLAPDDDAATG